MTRTRSLTRILAILFVLLAAVAAISVGTLKQGEDLLIQRRYAEAAAALEAALPDAGPGERDRVRFLLGRARYLAGDYEKAIEAFQRLRDEEKGSALWNQAAFQQAKALEAAGKKQQAAAIAMDRIRALTGLDRKEEVASTYLGLADKALAQEPPDRARAGTFFELALDLGLSRKKDRAVQLQLAECYLETNRAPQAIARLQGLVRDLPPDEGGLRARLLMGRARQASGDPAGARAVLRDLRALRPDAEESGEAAYLIAQSYGVPNPSPAQLDRAVGALREFRSSYPAHRKAKAALYLEAQCYRSVGRSEDALSALRRFLDEQGDSGIPEVAAARAEIGDVLLAQDKPQQAIAAWKDYLSKCPSHGDWERVQRAIVDAEYLIASRSYQRGKEGFEDARRQFLEFSAAHPLDSRNPEILYLLGEMLRQMDRPEEARDAFARCVAKYPGKDASSHAQFAIGELYETALFNYESALKAYRRVTYGPWARPAQQRIARLERKSLHLATRRTFRTDEKPSFEITSRNIERVRVRVYRLDLEDYFRATHAVGGVQRLDIEVIEPDATFESPVSDYVRYRETRRDVEIPFREPGAYVVKVDDRELEATTMVLVTDLALIVKSSRHELFAFAENTKENRVEAGVRVVVSDGRKVLAEGVTGSDGTWSWKEKDLQNLDGLSVFAVDAAGSGASTLDLSGLGYSQGLQPKGFLFTDRPLYRPGQRVEMKGIVREVENGLYRLPSAEGYSLRIHSADGRLVMQREIRFSEFGTFAASLDLPGDAGLGTWRIAVGRESGESFSGEFEVAKYERPKVRLDARAAQSVVFRGENLRGTIVATYFFGEPAVGKAIRYSLSLPDGGVIWREGTTNAAGEVPFEFETTEFSEEAFALISARMVVEDAAAQLVVPVVTTEFQPVVSTRRNVYLAGEPFDVEVAIRDRSGKALAREATAVLLRLEERRKGVRAGGQDAAEVVEVEVARHALATGADGKGSARFEASEGGSYRVRVEAEDRFGNLVSGSAMLTISADDDDVKLRLLGERDAYKVGERASAKVVNRAGPRLALVTVQGDGILWHEARVLPAGASEIAIELEPLHAPNFALALSMVDGERLHTCERDYRVLRDLEVTVKAPPEAEPGREIEVAIETRDPKGRPVEAEIALSMVDEALFALRPSGLPSIGEFFYGDLRETEFRTVSSCTWSYEGRSRRVSDALLAEERRQEREDEDALRREARSSEATEPGAGEPATGGIAGLERGRSPADSVPVAVRSRNQGAVLLPDAPAQNSASGLSRDRIEPDPSAARQVVSLNSDALDFQDMAKLGARDSFFAFPDRKQSAFDSNGWGYLALGETRDGGGASGGPRTIFSETGAWISSARTDAAGHGVVKISLPHGTTSWRLDARAVTVDSYVGEGTATLKTRKDLQAELIRPSVLTEGDSVDIEARVHNLAAGDRRVEARLQAEQGGRTSSFDRALEVAERGEAGFAAHVTAESSAVLGLELLARAGDLKDALRTSIPVQPFGVEVRDGRSGSTRDKVRFELGLPEGREYEALAMIVSLGPDPGRDLAAAALGAGFQPANCRRVAATNLSRASRGISALLSLDYVERTGGGARVERDALLALAKGMMAALIGAQRHDGSFAWIGQSTADARTTAQALRFLSACAKRGLSSAREPADKAAEWLLQRLRAAPNEERADLLWALADAGRARFESLNSLHRARNSLGVGDVARLALAFRGSGRSELLAEACETLRQRLAASKAAARIEEIALAASALLSADPRDALGLRLSAEVRKARLGGGWETPEATAAAIGLLAMAPATGLQKATDVVVRVNGRVLGERGPEGSAIDTELVVPADWISERSNVVEISVRGGGEVHYTANLLAFARGFSDEDRNDRLVRVERKYLADVLRFDDKPVPQGFSTIRGDGYRTFENEITKMRVGDTGRVRVSFLVRREQDRRAMTPLIVEEPIPAGCSVPRESISGSFERVDVLPDRLLFYYREGVAADTVRYELQARFSGSFRALPTKVQGALRPEMTAYGESGALAILSRGEGELDPYRLTPDELYYLASRLFEKAESETGEVRTRHLNEAREHLERLLADWQKRDYSLREDVFKEVARMMLFLSIERNDARGIVRFFEELKDRYPDLVIPFDRILAVASAYYDLGEFEAALLVCRATAEASYLKDAAVANTLEQLGEVRASAAFLRRLLVAYPDLPTMRSSRYGIAQKLASLAAAMDPSAPIDEKVGSAAQLRAQSLAEFREFLILYPEDPLAEEVSFAWATTCLEGKDLKAALALSLAALERYQKSPFTDEFLYTAGYAQFALGRHEEAFASLQRVATEDFPMPNGGTGPSESKYYAIYLQGQVHHARGEADKALEAYREVEDRFTDAGEAADYFLRKQLQLPEVTAFPLAEKPEIALTYRNVEKVSVQVYKVDLMRLYLQEKSLNDIRGIQLHGIAPLRNFEVVLGDGRDYRNRERKIPLDLGEPGAYLVVARGGDLLATGMVLCSDLRIETQESTDIGRVRVNVKQKDAFLASAHVKVIGSGDRSFRSGETDLRGIYVADGLVGLVTVIVKKGDQYAFYRGTEVHQPQVYRPVHQAPPGQEQQQDKRVLKGARKFDALEQNLNWNGLNRARQIDWLKNQVLENVQKGVEVQRTK
ncbi:MAG: hypothetical protein Fur0037_20230 [Planctomycetota bacterium]